MTTRLWTALCRYRSVWAAERQNASLDATKSDFNLWNATFAFSAMSLIWIYLYIYAHTLCIMGTPCVFPLSELTINVSTVLKYSKYSPKYLTTASDFPYWRLSKKTRNCIGKMLCLYVGSRPHEITQDEITVLFTDWSLSRMVSYYFASVCVLQDVHTHSPLTSSNPSSLGER